MSIDAASQTRTSRRIQNEKDPTALRGNGGGSGSPTVATNVVATRATACVVPVASKWPQFRVHTGTITDTTAERYHPPLRTTGSQADFSQGRAMHFDAHQPVINDLEARILTIRDSL
jgi:hypothetical protein